MEQVSQNYSFGGVLRKYKIASSKALGGLASQFNVFLPQSALEHSTKVPVVYYLAGLTCNEDTGAQKGGFLRDASEHGIALVFPDTSPRGAGVEGEDKDWDFGTGAGFYLDATSDAYSKHYNMYDFIVNELPTHLAQLPLDLKRSSIMGHSMGGHGALTLYLKNPELYRSASAFAPIANPTQAPWGEKAFGGYLKGGIEDGKRYDATELLGQVNTDTKDHLKILVDVGTGDQFYNQKQLLLENFLKARDAAGLTEDQVRVNLHDNYDHSYWFISTFGPSHIKFHADILNALPGSQ
ncbi:S-formylglutathione hydrolase [Sporobolomyces koalae]|uniref:S-formylglutathione hydrolase n=1 Tax=Sporobolomyces koalae TaxID=500713 RepID=UPI0031758FBC